jgi:hypothetical protein
VLFWIENHVSYREELTALNTLELPHNGHQAIEVIGKYFLVTVQAGAVLRISLDHYTTFVLAPPATDNSEELAFEASHFMHKFCVTDRLDGLFGVF